MKHAGWYKFTSTSEEPVASTFKVTVILHYHTIQQLMLYQAIYLLHVLLMHYIMYVQ